MKFFFDRCISCRIARMVQEYDPDHTARHLDDDDRFIPTTPDVEWLTALGAEEDLGSS